MLLYIHSNILNHFEGSFCCCCSVSLFFAALSLHCCAQAFSSCGKQRLLFTALHRLLAVMASLVVEQGLWGAPASAVRSLQLPGSRAQAQQLWCMGLVAPWREGSSQIRDGTPVSCTDRRILYHWATREAPIVERPLMVTTASKLGKLLGLPIDFNAWIKNTYYYITRWLQYLITVFQ